MSNESLVRGLMMAIEHGARGSALAAYFDPDAEQTEHPSAMNRSGGSRGLDGLLAGAEAGARMLASQSYEVLEFVDGGDAAAVRLTWRARTAIDLPGLPAGSELTAHIAQFYEFRDGRVRRRARTTATSRSRRLKADRSRRRAAASTRRVSRRDRPPAPCRRRGARARQLPS